MSVIPGIGNIDENSDLITLEACSDGFYRTGSLGVRQILTTGDRKVEFIVFPDNTIAYQSPTARPSPGSWQ